MERSIKVKKSCASCNYYLAQYNGGPKVCPWGDTYPACGRWNHGVEMVKYHMLHDAGECPPIEMIDYVD